MIGYLKGQLKTAVRNQLLINVQGVGYLVFVSEKVATERAPGTEVELYTYLQVSDRALVLYGFLTEVELSFFQSLLKVSGVGPKSALNILNKVTVQELSSALDKGDLDLLLGYKLTRKLAERLLVELTGKLPPLAGGAKSASIDSQWLGIISALENFGYNRLEIEEVIAQLKIEDPLESQLQQAFKLLGPKV